jgi:hypothetical protein
VTLPVAEPGEQPGDHERLVQRRARVLLDPPAEPSRGCAPASLPILLSDERGQLKRVRDVEPAELPGGDLSDDEVAALERPAEDDPRIALCGQTVPLRGRTVVGAYTEDVLRVSGPSGSPVSSHSR